MVSYTCTVCSNIRRKKKTEVSTAVAMSAINSDENATINNCSQHPPKGVSDFTEINLQAQHGYISACQPSGDVDPHGFKAPWNPPRVKFLNSDGGPYPEYKTGDNAYAGY